MGRYCPSPLRILSLAAVLVWGTVACGALESSPAPTATPSASQALGLEIAETYGQLLLQTRLIVESRPPAPEAKERLRLLREEYKVQFANYACLRDTMSEAEQAAIATAFDANRERYVPDDMGWFEDAAGDYDIEDPVIRERLEDIEMLDDYAFIERIAVSRPGEELLCG